MCGSRTFSQLGPAFQTKLFHFYHFKTHSLTLENRGDSESPVLPLGKWSLITPDFEYRTSVDNVHVRRLFPINVIYFSSFFLAPLHIGNDSHHIFKQGGQS